MSEVLAGLIGVVAGGVVTGAVQVFQTWQDRRLKRRVAARLIAGDLAATENLLDAVIEHDRWPQEPLSFDEELAKWLAQREPFAAAVTAYDWFMVESAYEHLDAFAKSSNPAQPLTESDRARVERNRQRLKRATRIASDRSASRRQRREVVRKWRETEVGGSPVRKS